MSWAFYNNHCLGCWAQSLETVGVLGLCILSHFCHVQLFVTPMACSPPGSSAHGVLQARILEWVAMVCPGYFRIITVWVAGHRAWRQQKYGVALDQYMVEVLIYQHWKQEQRNGQIPGVTPAVLQVLLTQEEKSADCLLTMGSDQGRYRGSSWLWKAGPRGTEL